MAFAPRDVDLVGTGGRRPVRPGDWKDAQLDVTSPSAVRALMEQVRPTTVFYCAYDKTNRAVTVDGAVLAARAAERAHASFVFFSSDQVFDGRTGGYTHESRVSPVSAYGVMKADAELLVAAEHPSAVVLRTSLLVGESGAMIRPAYECGTMLRGQPVTLYADEWRSPTHVDDVACAAWLLAGLDIPGVFHVAGPERLSRLELGRILCAIFRFEADLLREGDRPPERPRDTSLDSRRAVQLLGRQPRALSELANLAARTTGRV